MWNFRSKLWYFPRCEVTYEDQAGRWFKVNLRKKFKTLLGNPAYGRHSISWRVRLVAPLPKNPQNFSQKMGCWDTCRVIKTTKYLADAGKARGCCTNNLFIYQARESLAWSTQSFWQPSFCKKINLGSFCFDWGNGLCFYSLLSWRKGEVSRSWQDEKWTHLHFSLSPLRQCRDTSP